MKYLRSTLLEHRPCDIQLELHTEYDSPLVEYILHNFTALLVIGWQKAMIFIWGSYDYNYSILSYYIVN